MRYLFFLFSIIFGTGFWAQDLILPHSVSTHARHNTHQKQYFSTSIGTTASRLYLQTDLFAYRYPNMKYALSYERFDAYDQYTHRQSLNLKVNYTLPITRKLSFSLFGEAGVLKSTSFNLSYKGGVTMITRPLCLGYQILGWKDQLVHAVNLKTGPILRFPKQKSKYAPAVELKFSGYYAINDLDNIAATSNHLVAIASYTSIGIQAGVYQDADELLPVVGVLMKNYNRFSITTNFFLKKDDLPTVQFSFHYSILNRKVIFRPIGIVDF